MSEIHKFIGYAIPIGFGLMALWALLAFFRNRSPAEWFWRAVALVQVLLGLQVAVGIFLLLAGLVPPGRGGAWLHYAYGGLFPFAVLVAAHRYARTHAEVAWVIFGIAALVNFGLTFRALMTGLGI
jgi:hypothetical protein